METTLQNLPRIEWCALKPSLVEWKLYNSIQSKSKHISLETFLGGMETKLSLCAKAQLYCLLETFLGGMETEKTFPRRGRPVVLETFLGGMET